MKLIKLTRGKFAKISDEDFDTISKHSWFAYKDGTNFYAATTIVINGIRKRIKMHRLIMGLQVGESKMVDHKDRDGLNNQRSNIRLCNASENARNRKPRGTSKYIGVSLHTTKYTRFFKKEKTFKTYESKRWVSRIVVNNKQICLGRFDSEELAARAYDQAAIKHHNGFANLNFK